MRRAILTLSLALASTLVACARPGIDPPASAPTAPEPCNCAAVCLCQGIEPGPEQIEESRRAAQRCDEAGTPCACPICEAG